MRIGRIGSMVDAKLYGAEEIDRRIFKLVVISSQINRKCEVMKNNKTKKVLDWNKNYSKIYIILY